jgi:hypothetical protein
MKADNVVAAFAKSLALTALAVALTNCGYNPAGTENPVKIFTGKDTKKLVDQARAYVVTRPYWTQQSEIKRKTEEENINKILNKKLPKSGVWLGVVVGNKGEASFYHCKRSKTDSRDIRKDRGHLTKVTIDAPATEDTERDYNVIPGANTKPHDNNICPLDSESGQIQKYVFDIKTDSYR